MNWSNWTSTPRASVGAFADQVVAPIRGLASSTGEQVVPTPAHPTKVKGGRPNIFGQATRVLTDSLVIALIVGSYEINFQRRGAPTGSCPELR